MFKKVFTTMTAVALAIGSLAVPALMTPAQAQVSGTYSCRAQSPYAWGVGTHVNGNVACNIALQQCAIRTPYGSTCYVTNWWYNY